MRDRVAIALAIIILSSFTAGCLCFDPNNDAPSDRSINTGPEMNVPDLPSLVDYQVPKPSYTVENTTVTNYWKTDDGYYFSWSNTYRSNDPADVDRIRALAKMPIPTIDKVSGRIFNATFINFGRA